MCSGKSNPFSISSGGRVRSFSSSFSSFSLYLDELELDGPLVKDPIVLGISFPPGERHCGLLKSLIARTAEG